MESGAQSLRLHFFLSPAGYARFDLLTLIFIFFKRISYIFSGTYHEVTLVRGVVQRFR